MAKIIETSEKAVEEILQTHYYIHIQAPGLYLGSLKVPVCLYCVK